MSVSLVVLLGKDPSCLQWAAVWSTPKIFRTQATRQQQAN
jgi:hypothetical protein